MTVQDFDVDPAMCRPRCTCIQSQAVCFGFSRGQDLQLSLVYFHILKPLLSFKGRRNTVLIAQNVAKAFIIDLSVY